MSLEQLIAANTAALEANTAALLGKSTGGTKSAAAEGEKTATAKPATKTKSKPASEHTREEMQAALTELKEAVDAAAAKAVISNAGGVAKMAEIPDDKIDAVYAAAKEAMAEAEGEGEGEDEM